MEPYEQEQWNQLDRRLAEAEKKLLATANLVKGGIPMVVSQQMRIDALIEQGWIVIRVTSVDTEGGIIRRIEGAWNARGASW